MLSFLPGDTSPFCGVGERDFLSFTRSSDGLLSRECSFDAERDFERESRRDADRLRESRFIERL